MTAKRSFLFLQGPCSPLFAHIADKLTAHGHAVHKINFNCGDMAYWLPRPAVAFRGKLETLPEFLKEIWQQQGITDQILFGNCRPVHRAAAEQAKTFGIRTHVLECGYFRPYWLTLEREGVNGHSSLPRDPEWFRKVGKQLPEPDAVAFQASFYVQAKHDVLYHLANMANCLFFPHYRNHIAISAPVQYAYYIRRFSLLKLTKKQERQKFDRLSEKKTNFYLLPLQLNSDAQIIHYSDFADMTAVIEYVMRSFARNAPADTSLAIKNHPLDLGLVNYQKIIRKFAQELGLIGRIIYLETGQINTLIQNALGMVTVNSTSGAHALELNCPTITLADPIYNLPGLTFQDGLDDFWSLCRPPDAELFRSFRHTVMYTTQINGNLYCKEGIELAATNAARLLAAEQSPLEKLLEKAETILITGATGAIGGALAKYYAKPGVTLILTGRNPDTLNQVAETCRKQGAQVLPHALDLLDIPALQKWLMELAAVKLPDLIIANAGISINHGDNRTGEQWPAMETLLDVNIKATFALVNALLPHLRQRGSGQIALMSSLAAYYGLPATPSYCASKAAIKSYGEAMRGWLAQEGILVNVIMPGYVKSEMTAAIPGPKPFLWPPEQAASHIAKGLAKNQARISFPFPLNFGTWLLAVVPPAISQRLLSLMGYGG